MNETKEINVATIIATRRREKGITQEELAAHVGVSKASVSKWENGQSYPDIVLLPQLAAYFDISIDTLMGYAPQMEKAEIDQLYRRLATDFAEKSFEDVVTECERLVKRYYSCYPLLVKIALLYINHAMLAPNEERSRELFAETLRLLERVSENSKDSQLVRIAVVYQAFCHLSLGNGEATLELLGDAPQTEIPDGVLRAQAYQLFGDTEKAEEIMQIELYQNVMTTFSSLVVVLQNNLGKLEKAEVVYKKATGLAQLFNMRQLNPNNAAMLFVLGAQMYQINGHTDKALELLAQYVDVCVNGFFPVELHGDEFFTRIEGWLAEHANTAPRNEATIKESMLNVVLLDPVFAPLAEHPEYRRLVQTLKAHFAPEGSSANDEG